MGVPTPDVSGSHGEEVPGAPGILDSSKPSLFHVASSLDQPWDTGPRPPAGLDLPCYAGPQGQAGLGAADGGLQGCL